MNVMAGTLKREEGLAWVEAEGQRWNVTPPAQGEHGQAVHVGVRPGDLELAPDGQGIPAQVIVVEPTGAETELLLQVGESRIIAVLHGRTTAQPDDQVFLRVDPAKAHVFDAATGRRME
jgi:multiple sugar transport system ATP-binding protein